MINAVAFYRHPESLNEVESTFEMTHCVSRHPPSQQYPYHPWGGQKGICLYIDCAWPNCMPGFQVLLPIYGKASWMSQHM